MKQIKQFFSGHNHQWAVVARDPERNKDVIDTNEYIVYSNDSLMLTDPGGMEIFPSVFSAVSSHYNPENISYIFSSHQDPDIISSLSLWLEINPQIQCYVSWVWKTFIPHFGGKDNLIALPDGGRKLNLAGLELEAVPAHYLHSSGNFHLYDPTARVYYSGDVGTALLPTDAENIFVEDFDKHIEYAREFHQRWMPSEKAKQEWCERVQHLNIDVLAPQHGALYRGKDVERFINWFSELEVGQAGKR